MSKPLNRLTAAALLVAALLPLCLCHGCGGCGRGHDGAPGAADSAARSPQEILEAPRAHDPEGLHGYALLVGQRNPDLDAADMAMIIHLCEGAMGELEQEVDNLDRVDDPQDTWETLSTLQKELWPQDLATLTAFLRSVPLPAPQQARVEQLFTTSVRVDTQLGSLYRRHLDGKPIFMLDVSAKTPAH